MIISKYKNEKKRRRKPPSASAISIAQTQVLKKKDIPVKYALTTCWGCTKAVTGSLEKAHIEPFSRGGSDHPSNYLLLCHNCHTSQPDAAPPEYQMEWLEKRPQAWESRFEPSPFATEFERMAGIKIEALCDLMIDKLGTQGMLSLFKRTLKGGSLDKAGMTTGNAMANAVYAFVDIYRREYLDK